MALNALETSVLALAGKGLSLSPMKTSHWLKSKSRPNTKTRLDGVIKAFGTCNLSG